MLKYGKVQRGYLGLMIRSVDGNLAREKDLFVTEGVYVDSIAENSAAGDAGIEVGDVITAVDDREVSTSAELLEIIGRHHPGDDVTITVDREGEEMEFLVTLRNQEGEEKMYERPDNEVLDSLGIELEEIDKKTARKLDIKEGLQITKLYPGKLKNQTDVRVGFIITKVNGDNVGSVDQFVKILEDSKGGVMIEGVYEDYPGTYYYAFGL